MNYLQKKKLAFMSIVNSVKGFVRNITGVFPLTLPNCVDEESITDYTIYGDSVQNGTPTPDNPIEVESVGEKTKNLFDVSKSENGTLDSGNGTDLGTDKYPNRCRSGFIFLTAGSYVVSFNELVSTGNYIHTYYSNNASSWIERLVFSKIGSVSRFTLTNDCYVRFTIQPINTNSDLVLNTETLKNYQPQLELGNTATVYEPYGYKIPITVGGKNLFDVNKITGGLGFEEYNGVQCLKYYDASSSSTKSFSYTDSFKENTRYTFTVKVYAAKGNENANTGIKFAYTDGTTATLQIAKMNTVYKYTTTADKTLRRIYNGEFHNIVRYIDLTITQLEEGTTATAYEPYHEPITTNIYLDEPLRKVDDYADYVDFENGKVVRHIAYERIDTITNKSSKANVFFSEIAQKPILTISNNAAIGYAISDKFQKNKFSYATLLSTAGKNNRIQSYITTSGDYRVAYIFDDPAITTVALAQEKVGDGFDVIYALETPTETLITLPKLSTFKGTSILNADTTIQSSNAEVTYYSTLKG